MSKNNTGLENTGENNSGHRNSGDSNSGNRNSGHCNSGHCNSGNRNSGHRNSGDSNSGNRNSGDCNSGDYNSGHCNSGDCNSGDYNSGHFNSGIFNTNEPKMRSFNKECDLTYTEFRNKFGYRDLPIRVCEWIYDGDMTKEEKDKIKGWSEMGGYLKTLSYKEAWAKAWSEATQSQKDWYFSLPNFDKNIFFDITGIDIQSKSLSGKKVEVKIDGVQYSATID